MHANFNFVYCLLVLVVELKARGIFSVVSVKFGEVFALGYLVLGNGFCTHPLRPRTQRFHCGFPKKIAPTRVVFESY